MVIFPKLAIFDRDGILNDLVDYGSDIQVAPRHLEDVSLCGGAESLLEFLRGRGVRTAVATNQPDIARGLVSVQESELINRAVIESLPIDACFVCPHDTPDACHCRKPKPGLLLEALSRFDCKPEDAIFVGDRQSDLDAGIAAGVFSIIVSKNCSHVEHGRFICVEEIDEVQSFLKDAS